MRVPISNHASRDVHSTVDDRLRGRRTKDGVVIRYPDFRNRRASLSPYVSGTSCSFVSKAAFTPAFAVCGGQARERIDDPAECQMMLRERVQDGRFRETYAHAFREIVSVNKYRSTSVIEFTT